MAGDSATTKFLLTRELEPGIGIANVGFLLATDRVRKPSTPKRPRRITSPMSNKRRNRGPQNRPAGSPPRARKPATSAAKQHRPNSRAARAAARERTQRRRQIRNVVVGGVIAAAFLGVVFLAVASHASTAGDSTNPSAFVLPRLGGSGKVRLASFVGHPTVVNFFASWCTECAGELPVFAQDAQALRGKVNFVEVNALETGDGLGFVEQHGVTPSTVAAIASDVGGSNGDGLYQALGGTGSMPLSAFYSSTGKLITTHTGAFDASSLSGELEQLYGVTVPA